ncbi:MAG: organomercurial lyase [Phycisphaerae bacterium]|nr:organomercurial lyase [Phycisphaerae bacterium]
MNKAGKIIIVVVLIVIVGFVIAIKQQGKNSASKPVAMANSNPNATTDSQLQNLENPTSTETAVKLPHLIDLGAGKCIPCKMMKPILDELKQDYKEQFKVTFIDVWENPDEAKKYKINIIPTQIFFDAFGKELFRHEGFYSKEDILGKWKELGITFEKTTSSVPVFERYVHKPAITDSRPKERICYMCDGDINPKTLVTVKTEKGDVRLCSPHCYFIMYSCLTEDKTNFESKVSVTDFSSGKSIPLSDASFLVRTDQQGRPVIQAYVDAEIAKQEQQASGGNLLAYNALKQNELSHRCGFCDRACYPQDAAEVVVEGGIRTWGCCSHCALGVAARTGKDIEVHEKDRLTGEPVVVKTLNGSVASLEPSAAVAWFGQRQKADGTWASAGCFHQGFFANADNLKKWVLEYNPRETGKLISIHQALADKMKLSPEQIQKACKIGECSPK